MYLFQIFHRQLQSCNGYGKSPSKMEIGYGYGNLYTKIHSKIQIVHIYLLNAVHQLI